MLSNIKKAHAAPRCQYIRLNDQPCAQPALQNHIFCRFHDLIDNPLPDTRLIPFVEDAATLQLALMQVIHSIQLAKIDRRTAGTILYALQISASNLKYLAAETGRPFDAKPKKQDDEEDSLPGPSLADQVLSMLNDYLEGEKQRDGEKENSEPVPLANPSCPSSEPSIAHPEPSSSLTRFSSDPCPVSLAPSPVFPAARMKENLAST